MGIIGDMFKKEGIVTTETNIESKVETRVNGKIIKLSEEGWGFVSSKDIKFTRIFFHWTSLKQNTLKFTELKMGMKVSFVAVEIPEKGFRAIKIEVIKDDEPNKS